MATTYEVKVLIAVPDGHYDDDGDDGESTMEHAVENTLLDGQETMGWLTIDVVNVRKEA